METLPEELYFLVNEYFLLHLRRVYDRFEGDIESAMVLGEIGHYNVKQLIESQSFTRAKKDLSMVDNEAFRSYLRGCNTQSISMSMGIPRETVRRKIKKLEELGWIERDEKGFLFITRAVKDEMQEFNRTTISDFQSLLKKLDKKK